MKQGMKLAWIRHVLAVTQLAFLVLDDLSPLMLR